MKITQVRAHVLRSALEQPFAFSQGWVSSRGATLVEVQTDEGVTGWGEALCQGLQPPEIAAAAIQHSLQHLLVGEDPLQPEVLWHRMYHYTRDYGQKGAVVGAISGVDIALWDICGKVRGAPVAMLLGGMFRSRVEAYATGFYRLNGPGEAARLAQEAEGHVAGGFRALKIKLGFGIDDDLEVMRAIKRVAGKQEVMIDVNHAYGVAEAIRLGRELEDMGWRLRWYEEPVVQEDLDGYAEVRRALATPIAGGENEYTLFGFKQLLEKRAIDIAQPDLCIAGGFTGCRHIVALAHAHGVQVNPHVWASAVGQAASLQLIAAIPVANHSLYPKDILLEFDTSSHPFRNELTSDPLKQKGGWVQIPQKPGLGIEVSRDIIERYSTQK
ncbi:MAG TPA: mandelate racemase/muconate lactonizing enzyme family protein [Burkholderiales bacterium]|nr:mandelate racemase/muconate lactonizing enzyme family protein [Burkholderiales bacterium]